jgi:hypothetical protein
VKFVPRNAGREPCNEYACGTPNHKGRLFPRKLLLTLMDFEKG